MIKDNVLSGNDAQGVLFRAVGIAKAAEMWYT